MIGGGNRRHFICVRQSRTQLQAKRIIVSLARENCMFIKTSSTLAARNCSVPVPRVSRNWSTSQSANGLHGAGLPDYKRRLQGEDVAIEAVDHLLCRLARHTAVDYFSARGDGNFSLSRCGEARGPGSTRPRRCDPQGGGPAERDDDDLAATGESLGRLQQRRLKCVEAFG